MANKRLVLKKNIEDFFNWIKKAVRSIFFALRHFWLLITIVIVILLLFFMIPLFNGAKFGNILEWYGNLGSSVKITNTAENIENIPLNHTNNMQHIISDEFLRSQVAAQNKKETHLASWNVAEFKKAKYEPHKVIKSPEATKEKDIKVLTQLKKAISNKQNKTKQVPRQHKIFEKQIKEIRSKQGPLKEELQQYYIKMENPNLAYLNMPESLVGTAEVFGPNSLYIKNRLISLYGIDTNPNIHDAKMAQQYLSDLVEGKEIQCEILAYKVQTQAATALCFVNGLFINKSLADHNLAENISLK